MRGDSVSGGPAPREPLPEHVWRAAYEEFSEGQGLGVFDKVRLRRAVQAALRAVASLSRGTPSNADVIYREFLGNPAIWAGIDDHVKRQFAERIAAALAA